MVYSANLENHMPVTEELQTQIEEAERNFREKKYDEALAANNAAIATAKDAITKDNFPLELGTHLVKITRDLGEWSRDRVESSDDGSEQFAEAQSILDKGLRRYPDDVRLLCEQGWLHYTIGHHDKALAAFEKALRRVTDTTSNDDRVYALEGAGASLRERDQFVKAENMFAKALGPDGEATTGILIERGWLRLYQRKYDLSFADFGEAIRSGATDNNRAEAMAGQIAACLADEAQEPGRIKTHTRDLVGEWVESNEISEEEAKSCIQKAVSVHSYINNYEAALLGCNLLLEYDPENIDFYDTKISALNWLRRFGEAEEVFQVTREKFGTRVGPWLYIAHTYYLQKRLKEAYGIFSGETFNEPDSAKRKTIANLIANNENAIEWTIIIARQMSPAAVAEQKVNAAMARFPNNINFIAEQAAVFFKKLEYQKAIDVFEKVLELDEYYEFAHKWLVAALRKQRKWAEADERIKHALDKLPMGSQLWEELAWLAYDQGDLQQAERHFAKAIQLDPYLIQRQFSRAEVLSQLKRTDDAFQIFAELKKRFPEYLQVAEQLGWFHLRRGEIVEAKEQFVSIEKKDLDSVLAINGLGGCDLEERHYKSAECAFRKAIELVDYEPQYHINLAWALLRQVKQPGEIPKAEEGIIQDLLDEAAASCRTALKLDAGNAKAYVCLGVNAFKRNALMDAEGYFRRSIELDPRDGGHVELGALYVQMGRYEEAKTELLKATELSKNDARAYIELANLYLLTGDISEAIRQCRRALGVDPNDDGANRGLAIALMRDGKYEEAEKVLRAAIPRLSLVKRWPLQLLLSEILIRLGDDKNKDRDLYTEALKHVNDARRAHVSPDADIYFHAGIAHFKLEDYGSARKSFSECLKKDRDRFEAERYEKLSTSMIRQERRSSKINIWGGVGTAILCGVLLAGLWIVYFWGPKRALVWPEAGEATKQAQEAKQAGLPEIPLEERIVDRSMLTVMTPLLLGLLVVGLLLPNLNKLKLPGGFEAEISELKTKENISSGPKGDIGFGSSLPIVSPGPGGRAG
jgi:tetratricopeptide (TPR) repeat protein